MESNSICSIGCRQAAPLVLGSLASDDYPLANTGEHRLEGYLAFPNTHYYVAQEEWDYPTSADPLSAQAEALRHHSG